MSQKVLESTNTLREFLFERVYNVQSARKEAGRARKVVRLLYRYFSQYPEKLPSEYARYSDEVEGMVVDYIAGMTDQYALNLAQGVSLNRGKKG
jgi:dGTPase